MAKPFDPTEKPGTVNALTASPHEGVVAETIRVPGGWVVRTLCWLTTEAEGPCAVAQTFVPFPHEPYPI